MSGNRAPWIAAALVIGCTGHGSDLEWSGSVRTVDGVELVWNERALARPDELSLERLWDAPRRPVADDDTTFQNPSQIRAAADRVYVLDAPAGHVVALDWDGTVRRWIGRRGGGPGELDRPGDLLLMHGLVGVTDRGVVDWFDSLGHHHQRTGPIRAGAMEFRSGLSMPGMVLGAWPLEHDRVMFESPRGWSIGAPGDSLRLIVPPFPSSRLAPGWATIAGGSCGRVGPGASGTILRLRCIALLVQVLDITGAAIREFGIPDQIETATPEELAAAAERVRAVHAPRGLPSGVLASLVDVRLSQIREKPRYRGIRSDGPLVAVWEQTPPELGDGTATLHVFATAGIYFGRITTGEQWIDFDLRDERLVALAREPESGLAYVVAYRLVVPPAVRAAAAAAFNP